MGSYLVNEADAPDISDQSRFDAADGADRDQLRAGMRSRFLGRDWETGPWVVYNERKAGHETRVHKHFANRIEFLIDGTIEWREQGKAPVVYGAGTMSYVDAGVSYGFTVLEDARILVAFDANPGYHAESEEARDRRRSSAAPPGAYLVDLADRPDISDQGRSKTADGHDPAAVQAGRVTRFLGRDEGPWVYYIERAAGDVNPFHKHQADRVEYLIEGEIEWREPGTEPVTYGAGTMSHVEAGTTYGFTVTRDAKILMVFDGSPGISYL